MRLGQDRAKFGRRERRGAEVEGSEGFPFRGVKFRHVQHRAIAEDGRVLGSVPLAVGGLMSEGKADVVFQQLKELNHWTHELGVPEDLNVFMLLSFLALPVIPSLKLSDQGLIDVDNFCKVSLWTK